MSADDHRSAALLGNRFEDSDALFHKQGKHLGVMDQGAIGINWGWIFIGCVQNHIHGLANPHAKPCTFSQDALVQLKQYSWPGNIRELKNVCQHVSALLPGEVIRKENLPLAIQESRPSGDTGYTLPEHGIDMESLEVDLIKQALAYTDGNKSQAAKLLGLSRDAFLYRLKKHDL